MHASATIDDADLLRHFLQTKDEQILSVLMERYVPLVYSVALRVSGNPETAAEVAQDVFLKLIEPPHVHMKKGIPLVAWLHRTARSRALDRMRSEKARRNRESEAALVMEQRQEALSGEALALLDEVIHRLPTHERELVLQRYFLGRSLGAIGRQAGLSEDAVRMRLKRSLERMRSMLGARGISTTAAILAGSLPSQARVAPPAGLLTAIKGKALAVTMTSAPAAGFSPLFYLMTTTQKCIAVASGLAFAGIVATVVATSRRGEVKPDVSPPSSRVETRSAAKNPDGKNDKASKSRVRETADEGYAELKAKYGDTRTRLAVNLAKRSSPLLLEMTELHFSDAFAEDRQVMQRGTLESLGEKLGLEPEQAAALEKLMPEYDKKEKELAERLVEATRNHPDDIAETILALDARAKGEMEEEEFNEIVGRTQKVLSVGCVSAIDSLGLTAAGMDTPNPFQNHPELAAEFEKFLNGEQAARYREIREKNEKEYKILYGETSIEEVSNTIDGMGKMLDAMRTMRGVGGR